MKSFLNDPNDNTGKDLREKVEIFLGYLFRKTDNEFFFHFQPVIIGLKARFFEFLSILNHFYCKTKKGGNIAKLQQKLCRVTYKG